MVEESVCTSDWLRGEEFQLHKDPTEDEVEFYKEPEDIEKCASEMQIIDLDGESQKRPLASSSILQHQRSPAPKPRGRIGDKTTRAISNQSSLLRFSNCYY